MFVAILAVVINIITVSVYIYQTDIMQSQQHASVWPYVEWRGVYNQETGYKLQIRNNGIGPALIKSALFYFDDQAVSHPDSLMVKLLGTDRFPHLTDHIENRVLPAGEVVNLIEIKDDQYAGLLYMNQLKGNFSYEICYESIYKDAWMSKGTTVTNSNCK